MSLATSAKSSSGGRLPIAIPPRYWREALRNAMVLGKRELLRTPGKILAVCLFTILLTCVSIGLFITLVMVPLLDLQRHWIAYPFFPWFVWLTVPLMLYAGSGTVASLLIRRREFALVVSFATVSTVYIVWVLYMINYSAARERVHAGASLSQLKWHMVIEWVSTIVAYSIGCFWIRWRRLARLSYRVH